jgi:hypothetical protein
LGLRESLPHSYPTFFYLFILLYTFLFLTKNTLLSPA